MLKGAKAENKRQYRSGARSDGERAEELHGADLNWFYQVFVECQDRKSKVMGGEQHNMQS